jgi:hypothetical protein
MKCNLTETGVKCHKNDDFFADRAAGRPSGLETAVPSLQNGQMC